MQKLTHITRIKNVKNGEDDAVRVYLSGNCLHNVQYYVHLLYLAQKPVLSRCIRSIRDRLGFFAEKQIILAQCVYRIVLIVQTV